MALRRRPGRGRPARAPEPWEKEDQAGPFPVIRLPILRSRGLFCVQERAGGGAIIPTAEIRPTVGPPRETAAWQTAWEATDVIETYLQGRAHPDQPDAERVAVAIDQVLALRYALVALTGPAHEEERPVPP